MKRKLHGRLEIRNFSSNLVSPRGHVISSMFMSEEKLEQFTESRDVRSVDHVVQPSVSRYEFSFIVMRVKKSWVSRGLFLSQHDYRHFIERQYLTAVTTTMLLIETVPSGPLIM